MRVSHQPSRLSSTAALAPPRFLLSLTTPTSGLPSHTHREAWHHALSALLLKTRRDLDRSRPRRGCIERCPLQLDTSLASLLVDNSARFFLFRSPALVSCPRHAKAVPLLTSRYGPQILLLLLDCTGLAFKTSRKTVGAVTRPLSLAHRLRASFLFPVPALAHPRLPPYFLNHITPFYNESRLNSMTWAWEKFGRATFGSVFGRGLASARPS